MFTAEYLQESTEYGSGLCAPTALDPIQTDDSAVYSPTRTPTGDSGQKRPRQECASGTFTVDGQDYTLHVATLLTW